jgi:hypothetical protein
VSAPGRAAPVARGGPHHLRAGMSSPPASIGGLAGALGGAASGGGVAGVAGITGAELETGARGPIDDAGWVTGA